MEYRHELNPSAAFQCGSITLFGGRKMSEALQRFGITRSIKDRVFLGLMGLLFGIPTGYAFILRFGSIPKEESNIWERIISWFVLEVAAVVLVLSVCAVVWAVATPRWLEDRFFRSIARFVQLLFLATILVLVMFIYAVVGGA